MSKTKQLRTAAEIEAAICDIPSLQRRAYVIALAVDKLIAEHEVALQIQLAQISVVFIPTLKDAELKVHDLDSAVENTKGGVFGVASHATAAKLAEFRQLKTALDTSETRTAVELLEPLFCELAEAKIREAAEAAEAAQERQAKIDLIEARKAALEADIERELAAVV
jgi:hypothetical protein